MTQSDLRLRDTQAATLGVLAYGYAVSLSFVAERLQLTRPVAQERLLVLKRRGLVERPRPSAYRLTVDGTAALAQHRAKVTRRKRTRRAALGIGLGDSA